MEGLGGNSEALEDLAEAIPQQGLELRSFADGGEAIAAFEAPAFLPHAVAPMLENDTETTSVVFSQEQHAGMLELVRYALQPVIRPMDGEAYANFGTMVETEITESGLPRSDAGYRLGQLRVALRVADNDQAATLAELYEQHAEALVQAMDYERGAVEALNRTTAVYRTEILARADWSAIFERRYPMEDLSRAEEWFAAGRYSRLLTAFSSLSPQTELPSSYSMATLVHSTLKELHSAMYAYGDVLPEGTEWQPPDPDWRPTPHFGEEAMAWRNDVDTVMSMIARPRSQFVFQSNHYARLCDVARIGSYMQMGADQTGPDEVPLQLYYEVEQRYTAAKQRLLETEQQFIESQPMTPLNQLKVEDPYNLAYHRALYNPERWAFNELEKLPSTMTSGIKCVRFDKKEHAATWTYKGETHQAAASYDDVAQTITLYVDEDELTRMIGEGWDPLDARDYLQRSASVLTGHEVMHHVHRWRATVGQLVDFLRRARQDDPVYVSPYVEEAYATETRLNGDAERFAETGAMFFGQPFTLLATSSGHHYGAFRDFLYSFIAGSAAAP